MLVVKSSLTKLLDEVVVVANFFAMALLRVVWLSPILAFSDEFSQSFIENNFIIDVDCSHVSFLRLQRSEIQNMN